MTPFTAWFQESAVPGLMGFLFQCLTLILIALLIYYLIQIGNQHVPDSKRLIFDPEVWKLLFFLSIGSAALFWLIVQHSVLLALLTPFILAGVIAYAFTPVISCLMKLSMTRFQSVVILYAAFLAGFILLSITIFPRLGAEIRHLAEQLPHYSRLWYHTLSAWYKTHLASFTFLPDGLDQTVSFFDLELEILSNWLVASLGDVMRGVGSLVTSLVTLITVPVLTFYFLKDAELIRRQAQRAVPPKSRSWVFALFTHIDHVLAGFIRGQLIVALIVGFLSGTALLILGIDFAILLGMVAGITNIIPYLGPFIGALPAVLIALLTSPLKTLWVILAFVVIQQVESSIISPKIVGKRVGLHPTLVILSLLVGGALWGLAGLIVAVPLAGILRVFILAALDWFKKSYPDYFESS